MDDASVGATLAGLEDVSNVLLLTSEFGAGCPETCGTLLEPSDGESVSVVGVAVAVTPDEWASRVMERLSPPPTDVCVVAVGEETRSAATESAGVTPTGDACVKRVASASNLTEVGVRLTECIEDAAADELTLCFSSLTALLPHVEIRLAFQFLNVLTSLVGANDGLAHYHLDPAAAEERDVAKLRPLFDAIVERDADGDLVVRTR